MYSSLKKHIHFLLDPNEGNTIWDKIIDYSIVILILLNTIAVILETVSSIHKSYYEFFKIFEIISVSIFSIEYVLRLWSCTYDSRYKHFLWGRIKYMLTFGAIIDLLAILPFFLPLLIGYDLRFIRILRLIRFFRFFKLSRYFNASKVISRVIASKKEELILSVIITFFLIIIASSLMYFTEHDAQPEKFSSIPETMWWSVATLTTVGYGDVYPITTLGKTLTALISILGIGMFALPAGILASGFSEEFSKNKKNKPQCPHCNKEL